MYKGIKDNLVISVMVSLYRAWAAWRGIGGGPGAPDAMVQAGGVRFAAHARLLAAHSGYFKSVLLQARPWALAEDRPFEEKQHEAEGSLLERERREYEARFQDTSRADLTIPPNEDHVVYVPNISAQQFWPLLAYMYTGYLELTPENIYQVLLATHLLHMPRALELCRSFLAQGSAAPLSALPTTTVVKPIPSRKLPPFMPTTSFHPLYPEPPVPFLRAQHNTPFRPVDPTVPQSIVPVGENVAIEHSLQFENHTSAKEILEIPSYRINRQSPTTSKNNDEAALGAEESTGRNEEPFVKAGRSRDALNLVKLRKSKAGVKLSVAKKAELINPTDDTVVVVKAKPESKIISSHAQDNKIVIDVACCDGPVRFHRVLNTAYKSNGNNTQRADSDSSDTDDSYIEIEEDSRSQSETTAPYDNCNAFSKSLQKQMSENIRSMGTSHNENQPNCTAEEPTKIDGQDPDASNSDVSSKQDTIYTCVYCNHTFKSQYCYQKHARRHINPVSIDAVNQGTLDMIADPCCKVRNLSGAKAPAVPRREVRLLDMNVQYYPCKTCGSKFPSYYFVHKHRKMCHAEELENGQEVSGKAVSGDRKRKSPPNSTVSYSAAGGSREEVPAEVNEVASDKTETQDAPAN